MNGADPLFLILDLDENGVKKFSKRQLSSKDDQADNSPK